MGAPSGRPLFRRQIRTFFFSSYLCMSISFAHRRQLPLKFRLGPEPHQLDHIVCHALCLAHHQRIRPEELRVRDSVELGPVVPEGAGILKERGAVQPVSTTLSTKVVSWVISIGSSPFSTARKTPDTSMRRSLLVTKWINFEMFADER